MLEKLFLELEELYPQMVEWRRHLHQHPELSFKEVQTPKMIAELLESWGIEGSKLWWRWGCWYYSRGKAR